MVLPIYNVIVKIDKDVISAAKDLGANNVQTFFENHTAAYYSWDHQWDYDGICACAHYLCYLRFAWRK